MSRLPLGAPLSGVDAAPSDHSSIEEVRLSGDSAHFHHFDPEDDGKGEQSVGTCAELGAENALAQCFLDLLIAQNPNLLYKPDTILKDTFLDNGVLGERGYLRLGDLIKESKKQCSLDPKIEGGMCFAQMPATSFLTSLWDEITTRPISFPHLSPSLNYYNKLDAFINTMWGEAAQKFVDIVDARHLTDDSDEPYSYGDRTRTFSTMSVPNWHDDRGSDRSLVMMLTTLREPLSNERAGTLIMDEKTKDVYQNAGWHGGKSFTLTVFPSRSDVYNHAAPVGDGSRISLTWRLYTHTDHTQKIDAQYQELMQFVHDKMVGFDPNPDRPLK